jgi:hypothetical protein
MDDRGMATYAGLDEGRLQLTYKQDVEPVLELNAYERNNAEVRVRHRHLQQERLQESG